MNRTTRNLWVAEGEGFELLFFYVPFSLFFITFPRAFLYHDFRMLTIGVDFTAVPDNTHDNPVSLDFTDA